MRIPNRTTMKAAVSRKRADKPDYCSYCGHWTEHHQPHGCTIHTGDPMDPRCDCTASRRQLVEGARA